MPSLRHCGLIRLTKNSSIAYATKTLGVPTKLRLDSSKVNNKWEDKRRELQFAERMMQGPRIVAELVRLKRSLH